MNLIVAADAAWGIGKDGEQMVYIAPDLKRFRRLTSGHPVLVGRKTLATFPGGRPLKNRRNLILSRDPSFTVEGGEVFRSLTEALSAAPEDTIVLGGGSVYAQAVDACDTAYVTRIHTAFPGVDCWFPDLDKDPAWQIVETDGPYVWGEVAYSYLTYRRVAPTA